MKSIAERVAGSRVIAIVRTDELTVDAALRIVETLAVAGLDTVEFTLNSNNALRAIQAVADRIGDQALVGAGTVIDGADVQSVADAGGRFIVSPHLDVDLVRGAHARGLGSVPGVYTATEIQRAVNARADLIKLFPASPPGVGYLRALRGPFPDVPFVPTGGISINDVPTFLAAGAVAVGLGSALVRSRDPLAGLAERAEALWQVINRSSRTCPGDPPPMRMRPDSDRP